MRGLKWEEKKKEVNDYMIKIKLLKRWSWTWNCVVINRFEWFWIKRELYEWLEPSIHYKKKESFRQEEKRKRRKGETYQLQKNSQQLHSSKENSSSMRHILIQLKSTQEILWRMFDFSFFLSWSLPTENEPNSSKMQFSDVDCFVDCFVDCYYSVDSCVLVLNEWNNKISSETLLQRLK